MMMIAFITFNSSLVPLVEGLCSSNPCELSIQLTEVQNTYSVLFP